MAYANRRRTVIALGSAQTLAWASSYYLPAILAAPIAASLALEPVWVFGAFSAALLISGFAGPLVGIWIDRRGGRTALSASNVVLAAGLALLAACDGPVMLFAAWLVIGAGMALGLYEPAFATLAGLYGQDARRSITHITLIAGFASTVGWPLTTLFAELLGWRGACLAWAALHLTIGWPLNRALPLPASPAAVIAGSGESAAEPASEASSTAAAPAAVPGAPQPAALSERTTLALLAWAFAASLAVAAAMATHLPTLLQLAGAPLSVAVGAASLIGPAQVAARIAEASLLARWHPLATARLSAVLHPVGIVALLVPPAIGLPAATAIGAVAFAAMHGAGNGILTIVRGTVPLALFGTRDYGRRLGLISAPSRIAQAAAPLAFALLVAPLGIATFAVTAALSLSALAALLLLRARAVQPAAAPAALR